MKPVFPICRSIVIVLAGWGAGRAGAQDLPVLAAAALSGGDADVVRTLRDSGPRGLTALLEAAGPRLEALRSNRVRLGAPEAAPLRAAMDSVAGQRDGWASSLYWFTDLEAAKVEAVKSGRKILSLRLLGNLDEEYCCANSRFFRTVLYANAAVSKVLRERYVLHWKSVRPAPLLTIDMGDGRRIKRTITGNSIHYILDAEGKVIDALPGIYSASAFLAGLDRAETEIAEIRQWIPAQGNAKTGLVGKSPEAIRQSHGAAAHRSCMEWLAAAAKAGVYGDKARNSMVGVEQSGHVLSELFREAFPAGQFDERGQGYWVMLLDQAQQWRFEGAVQADADPVKPSPAIEYDPILGSRLKRKEVPEIKTFTYPSDFDPPKGMVERPILKQTVPPANEENSGFPKTAKVPLDSEFDPPQIPKGMVEGPVMKKALPGNANEALDPASPAQPGPSLAGRMTQAWWAAIAVPCRQWVRLDESSRRMMMQKLPEEVMTASELKTGQPDHAATAFGRLLARFEEAIARDMVRNEYYYHTQIHQWLEEDKEGSLTGDVEALNRRVYQELFLTPDYDAWLGLVPDDTYTALEKDGCACDKGAPPMRKAER